MSLIKIQVRRLFSRTIKTFISVKIELVGGLDYLFPYMEFPPRIPCSL